MPAHIVTEAADSGALYARNPYSNDYGDWIGFFDVDEALRAPGSFTCDRAEFLGRNGSMRQPAALGRARLGARIGPALDPCAAIQVPMNLQDGEDGEVVFRLGMGRSTDEADELALRLRIEGSLHDLLDEESTPLSAADRREIAADVMNNVMGYGPIQEFLDDPQVGASDKEVRRECMPERVWADLPFDTRKPRVFHYYTSYLPIGQPFPALVEKKRRVASGNGLLLCCQPALRYLCCSICV